MPSIPLKYGHVTATLVYMLRFIWLTLTESKEDIYFGKKEKKDLFKASCKEAEYPICLKSPSPSV